ncbi:putative transporter MCH2 [Pichia kudriavzevii]|uniref:Putative transporter MCH2 n=1 Tax=Pichia kudriavzevii TaxID=4909 RepID=A0A1V2LFS4_PICKU|nr:putative transporter MCH2 [Pichia kudriavzevii]
MNDAVNDEEQGNFSETKQTAIDTGKYSAFDFKNRPPDGGFWAWISVVCVLFINTFSWGLNACFGVYLNYYVTEKYFENANTEQYVMIGGLALGLSFTACAFTNGLCRHVHYKIIMTIGLIITFLSYWLASIATTVVQLIFFQGFLMAFGWALTAGSTFLILPTWFLEKRSIAQGIATAGGGLGGIIFSRASDQIIKQYLTNPKYAGDPNHALRLGVAWALRMEALGSNVTTVQSVAQTVGRPLLGFLSDKIGRVNVTLISTILITIFSFVFWIFVTTYAQLIGFAFAVGILLGVNWVNFGPMTADVVGGGGADMNHAVSLQMFVGGFPMLIAELAGFKLRRFDMERPFLYCQILVGVAAGVSCLALLPFREWKVKRAVKARIAYLKHSVNNLDGDEEEEEEEEDAALAGMDGEQMEREIMKMERLLAADVRSYMYRAVYPLKV